MIIILSAFVSVLIGAVIWLSAETGRLRADLQSVAQATLKLDACQRAMTEHLRALNELVKEL